MDWCANWWWMYILLSVLSGLIGWFLHQYFDQKKITERDLQIKDGEYRFQSLFADFNELSISKNDSINALHAEKESLQELLTAERRKIASLKTVPDTEPAIINSLTSIPDPISSPAPEPVSESDSNELALLKDENTYLKTENSRLQDTELPMMSSRLKKEKRKRKKLKSEHKKVQSQYNKIVKSTANQKTKKLGQKKTSTTIVKEIPVEIIREIIVEERIDYKKLKKLLINKLPIRKSKQIIQTSEKKGKPRILKK